jgi:putative oxidoreductase
MPLLAGTVRRSGQFIFGNQGDRSAIMLDFTRQRLVWEPRMLSISRIMIGLLFMEHGTAKLLDFPHQETHKAFDLLTLNPGVQGSIELVGGLLFALGLFTRPVAFVLAGDVAVAYFMAHAPKGFFPLLNGGELAIVYCFAFLYFWLAGGGAWSLDRLFATKPAVPEMPDAETRFVGEPWAVRRVSAAAPEDRAAARAETAMDGSRAGPTADRADGRDRGGQSPPPTERF